MIVEFVGSTGSGKTTLIRKVRQKLAPIAEVTTAFDLVASPLDLQGVTHPTVRNLIQEVIGLPFFIGSLRRHKAYVAYTLRMLARQANFSVYTLNNLRSLERKISMYEINRRRERNRIVLVDEGTVLMTHVVFVYGDALYTNAELEKFAGLLPLPDVIVYVRAPFETLVERSLQRDDPPRELKSKDRVTVEKYIHRAITTFDRLVEVENIRNRLLVVENSGKASQQQETTVESIVKFLLIKELRSKSVC